MSLFLNGSHVILSQMKLIIYSKVLFVHRRQFHFFALHKNIEQTSHDFALLLINA